MLYLLLKLCKSYYADLYVLYQNISIGLLLHLSSVRQSGSVIS